MSHCYISEESKCSNGTRILLQGQAEAKWVDSFSLKSLYLLTGWNLAILLPWPLNLRYETPVLQTLPGKC